MELLSLHLLRRGRQQVQQRLLTPSFLLRPSDIQQEESKRRGQPAPVSASAQAGRAQRSDPSGRVRRYHSSADSLLPGRGGRQRRFLDHTIPGEARGVGGNLPG
ncbi:hypothetical protein ILYODFUR_004468 [Ilyodon furcidens]|uniref:Uncharacterized protein n=1 Tax=Ilyodon furcidens TaxID=33524 RepID=A0ABV0VB08_9TELE